MAFPTVALVQTAIDDMKLLPTVTDSVKVINLMHFIESSMTKFVPERLVFEPKYPSNNQSRNPVCLITRQIKYASKIGRNVVFSPPPKLKNRLP
ncbi:unnamed protein product [Hymenolepis diminuta]|uniref:Uncharacterized protein n=1 Tax=Hymenolepis diminuta TaxID=6216 RepID=A0A564Y6K3_HYMDI|nr:unnamed protein product [Hymenolepis diminuta]